MPTADSVTAPMEQVAAGLKTQITSARTSLAAFTGGNHNMFAADVGYLLKQEQSKTNATFSGDVDADLLVEICNAYNLTFLDAYLKDGPAEAIAALGDMYEVVISGSTE